MIAIHPFRLITAVLLSGLVLSLATTSQATDLGPVFPVNNGMQLATRPQGTTSFAEVYNSGINYYSEIRVWSLEALDNNPSAYQGYSMASFALSSPDVAVNETNGIACFANYYAYVWDEGSYFMISRFQFDANGTPTTGISNVTEYALSRSTGYSPVVRTDMNRSGRAAVVYFSETAEFQLPLFEEYIMAQLINADGSSVGPAVAVNQRRIGYWPVVAVTPEGGAMVVWEDATVSAYSYDPGHDIYARRIDLNGNPVGSDFRVNATLAGRHQDAEIAINNNGTVAVVWTQSSSDANGVYLQCFNADGSRRGSELRVSPYNGTDPQVAMASDGRFVVAWQGQDDDAYGIFAQRFQTDGSFLGKALWVNEGASNSQTHPLLGIADDGNIIMKWSEGDAHFARWIAWSATNQTQLIGPRVQTISPASPVAGAVGQVTVTFDRLMNSSTFVTNSAHLIDPVGRIIHVTSVQSILNPTFTLDFAPQHLPGRYQVIIGPEIQDAEGALMDENGNMIAGEAGDTFLGYFELASAQTAVFPLTEGFEAGPDALSGWTFTPYHTGSITFTTNGLPHSGTNHLWFTDSSELSVTLALDLSGQEGQTNLFLSFWAKGTGWLNVEVSGDGETWFPMLSYNLSGSEVLHDYTEFALDLDQAALSNGIILDNSVYVRLRFPNGVNAYLDDVRVLAGALPLGPRVTSYSPTRLASSNPTLTAITVTFDRAIDPASFSAADVELHNPQRTATIPAVVTPVEGSGNTQYILAFAEQIVRGDYQLIIGPAIADTGGHFMNQNGNSANGEPSDYYTGIVTFEPVAAQPGFGPVLFEETFENWPLVSSNWSFSLVPHGHGDVSTTYPRRGLKHLELGAYGGNTSTGAHSGMIVLACDLSGLASQTNLFLEFGSRGGTPNVEVSNDSQTWHMLSCQQNLAAGQLNGYLQFTVDLDEALTTNGINFAETVFIRFRATIPPSPYNQGDVSIYLDDVRILAGNPDELIPPSITIHPQHQTGYVGYPVSLSVLATGSEPLSFQWFFNGTNLVGETNASLIISSAQLDDAGTYLVVITNLAGSISSEPAILTVTPAGPRVISDARLEYTSTNESLSTFTVAFNQAIDPATFTPLDVVLRNPLGVVISNVVVLPVSGSGNTQFSLSFLNQRIRGDYPFVLGPNIANLSGQWMNQNGTGTNGEPTDLFQGYVRYEAEIVTEPVIEGFEAANLEDLGVYWSFALTVGTISISTNNQHAGTHGLQMIAPFIGVWDGAVYYQEATMHVNLSGQTNVTLVFWNRRLNGSYNGASVSASADGVTWTDVSSFGWVQNYPSDYQRRSFDLDALGLTYSDDVRIRFRSYGNLDGGTFVWDDIRVLAGIHQPYVVTQPQDQSMVRGNTAALRVEVDGREPFSYQWYKGSTALVDAGRIQGATNCTLFISGTQLSDSGNYTVIALNQFNSVTSQVAVLTVAPNQAPSFLKGTNISVPQGNVARSFSGWATSIQPGPVAWETNQNVQFDVTASPPGLFAVAPVIAPGGVLSFTPARNARGTATLTVVLYDNGGTNEGGVDSSTPEAFTITIGQTADSDSDGMPDDFELVNGLNPNSSADAALDSDGDGFTNAQEFRSGTDPGVASDVLNVFITESADSGIIKIYFTSILTKSYRLERNLSFPIDSWSIIADNISGTGGLIQVQDDPAAGLTQAVYRVVVQP
jgi:hypothetical protein